MIKIKNRKIIKIMKNGIIASLILTLISTLILEMYSSQGLPEAFYIGKSLFKSGLFFISMFIICGFVFDRIIT